MKKPAKKQSAKQNKKQRKKQQKNLATPKKLTTAPKKVASTASPKAQIKTRVEPSSTPILPFASAPKDLALTQSASASSPNRLAFFCFLAIFACMLVLESARFKIYFDGESGEYPFLRPVGEYISQVAEKSGIEAITESVGQWTRALSQEFLVVADVEMAEQWQNAKEFYAETLGLQIAPKSIATPTAKPATEPMPAPATEPQEPSTPVIAEKKPQSTEQSSSSAPVAQEKEEMAQQPAPYYAYYDASRVMPAPTEYSLEEYVTKLPDYGKKVKVLLIGDSMMMEGLGPTLQKSLRKRADLDVVREGRYSSGLSKPDFFNWPENLDKLLLKHDPQVLIISLGANDTQDIMVGKRRFQIDTEGWERVYAIRVLNFLEQATENNRQVLWVSLPVMSLMPYANRTKLINAITGQMSSFYPTVAYENIEHLLTKNGKFASFIQGENNKTIRLRSKDKIHVSTAGGQILTDYLLPYAEERVERIRMQEVDNNPYIPVAGKANIIRFSSASRQKQAEYVVYLPSAQEEVKENDATLASIMAIQSQAENKEKAPTLPDLVQLSLQTDTKSSQDSAPESFPVLYLLHGATSHASDWNKYMGKELQHIANEQRVIIVAPASEEYGWYVNSPKVAHNQIESFLIDELIPQVDMLFPTNGKRGIAGLSMGGHGALTLGLKYPKTFQSIASVSGVVDIRLHAHQWKLSQLLGDYEQNKTVWNKNSALYLMEKAKTNAMPQNILISTGLQDSLVLEDNQKAKEVLEKRKITFEYSELEGTHDWDFWKQEIPRQLRKQADFLHNK